MEKKQAKKNIKAIGIICIIAIILSLASQFITGWSYSGIITNDATGEQHVQNLKTSLAKFVWMPYKAESVAFEKFLINPSIRYEEKTKTAEFTAEETAVLEPKLTKQFDVNNPKIKDSEFSYHTTLVEIREYHHDIADKANGTVFSAADNKDAKLKKYDAFTKNSGNHVKFLYKIVLFPLILFLVSIVSIVVIIFSILKGQNRFTAPICALLVGVLSIIMLHVHPVFVFSLSGKFAVMRALCIIGTVVGLLVLLKSISTNVKEAKRAKEDM